MRLLLATSLLCLLNFFSYSQNTLEGKVESATGERLPYAVVSLHENGDSLSLANTLTDTKGNFSFKRLASGVYQLSVQMMGYVTAKQTIIIPLTVPLPPITLAEAPSLLEEVEIVAEQSYIENGLGKKTLYLGQDLTNAGGSAAEALARLPAITTTPQGDVQVRGSSNVIIYINGKETQRDVSTLQFISAEALEKIEVITNPSAAYDAEGVGGIINLVYKKNLFAKLKLESLLNLAAPARLSGGVNASINRDRFSFYTNVLLGRSWYANTFDAHRFNQEEDLRRYQNEVQHEGIQNRRIVNIGMNYEPDTSFSLGLELSYNRWDDEEEGLQTNTFVYTDEIEEVRFSNIQTELEDEISLNFSLQKIFHNTHQLQLLLSASGEDENNTNSVDALEDLQLRSSTEQFLRTSEEVESQRLYQVKVDYTLPFLTKGTVAIGAKLDWIQYDILQEIVLQDDSLTVPDNDFTMVLQKQATYLTYQQAFRKWEYAIGVRVEQFTSNGQQRTTQETFAQDVFRVFPSLQAIYLFSGRSHTLGVSYTRRINRPSFFDLNPYVSYQDPLNLQTGNPNLRPEMANLYEVNYHNELLEVGWDVTVFRRETYDVIQEVVQAADGDQTLQSLANFDNRVDQGVELQADYTWAKGIESTLQFTLATARFKDINNAVNFNRLLTWGGRWQQRVRWGEEWGLDFSATYRAPRIEPQRKVLAQYYFDMALRKKFHKRRGTITINLQDIFDTRIFINQLQGTDFSVERSYKWQTRQLSLGIRYFIFRG